MLDKLALDVLFELGKLAIAGVSSLVQLAVKGASSLVSSNESTAAETQGPPELNAVQTNALNELNELSDAKKEETRKQLLEKLDATSKETLDKARMAAEIQAAQANKVQKELFADPATLLLPQSLFPETIIPRAPYFDALRKFETQTKEFKTKTDELVSRIGKAEFTFEALCGEIGQNLKGFERKLQEVQPEPGNLFLDFCYFFSGIPKPPSLYELNQEFPKKTKVEDIASAFKGVSESTPGNRNKKLDHLGLILRDQIQQILGTLEKSFPPRLVAPLSTAANLLCQQHPFSRKSEPKKVPPEPEKGNDPSSENPGPRKQ